MHFTSCANCSTAVFYVNRTPVKTINPRGTAKAGTYRLCSLRLQRLSTMGAMRDSDATTSGWTSDSNVPPLRLAPPFITDFVHAATGMRMKISAAGSEVTRDTSRSLLTRRSIGVPFYSWLKVLDIIRVHS